MIYNLDTVRDDIILDIGIQGEDNARQVRFDISAWLAAWPGGTIEIQYKRPEDTGTYDVLPSKFSVVDGVLTWIIDINQTVYGGYGYAIITYRQGGVVRKSPRFNTLVKAGLPPAGPAPDTVADWIAEANTALNAIETLEFTINDNGELLAGETVLGRVSDNPRGDYNPDADPLYSKRDIVFDNGGSYRYINDTPSNEPTSSTSHWQQIAEKGETGDVSTAQMTAAIGAAIAPVNAQLAAIELHRYGFDEYGFFVKPSDFLPTLPCNFYRDSNNIVQHDMDFGIYTLDATIIYVNLDGGSDTTGNGSYETPYKTITKACTVIEASADGSYCIKVINTSPFGRDQGIKIHTFENKTVAIVPATPGNRIIMTMNEPGLSWIEDGAGTWKTTRSLVYSVFDYREKDSDGVYIPYTAQNSLVDCKAHANSWYTDNTYVWIHTSDGLEPTESTIVVNVGTNPQPTLLGTSRLYFENIDFLLGNDATNIMIRGDVSGSTVVGEFCAKNCTFAGGNLRYDRSASTNAFGVLDVAKTYLFDCKSSYAKADCFNYHYTNVPSDNRRDCLALEYYCKGRDAGVFQQDSNNNISTCHDGVNIIRFGTVGVNASIPIADVGGCYSICIDCDMSGARHTSGTYYFGYSTDANGKAIVIGSTSDNDAKGLYADVQTYVYNFIGNIYDTGKQMVLA